MVKILCTLLSRRRQLLGALPPESTWASPMDPIGGRKSPRPPKFAPPPEIIPGYATAATTTTTTTLHADTDNTEHRNDDSRAKYCFAVGWCAQTTTVSENLGGLLNLVNIRGLDVKTGVKRLLQVSKTDMNQATMSTHATTYSDMRTQQLHNIRLRPDLQNILPFIIRLS